MLLTQSNISCAAFNKNKNNFLDNEHALLLSLFNFVMLSYILYNGNN